MTAASSPKTITSIQTLRAIAALAVVVVHASHDASVYSGVTWLGDVGGVGAIGVDVFFVISGFIMFVTACARPVTPATFIADRVARIVPLYWIATIALAVLSFAGRSIPHPHPDQLARSLAFIPFEEEPGFVVPYLHVGWTLNFEMFFYAVLAAALQFRPHHMAAVTGSLIAMALCSLLVDSQHPILWTYTNPMLLEFLAGMWVGKVWMQDGRPPKALGIALLVVAVAIVGAAYALSMPIAGWTRAGVWGVPAVAIVVGFLSFEGARIVGTRLGLVLGGASYSIYLFHTHVLLVLGRVWSVLGITSGAVILVASVAASAVFGIVIWMAVEKVVTRSARRLLTTAPSTSFGTRALPQAPKRGEA